MSTAISIIKRALKHGFNLSSIPDYNPKNFMYGLYDFLLDKHYSVVEEEGDIYVGYNIVDDIVKITLEGDTLKVKPLKEEGFFEILMEVFRYIYKASGTPTEDHPDDDPTESYSDNEEESEELWL